MDNRSKQPAFLFSCTHMHFTPARRVTNNFSTGTTEHHTDQGHGVCLFQTAERRRLIDFLRATLVSSAF